MQNIHRKSIIAVCVIIVILFAYQTWDRISVWKDTEHLYFDIIEKNPGNSANSYTYYYLGLLEKNEGNNKEALELITNSILINHDYYSAFSRRGEIYEKIGKPELAIKDYDKAIMLNPKVAENYNLRGFALFELRDTAIAIRDYNQAILLDTGYAEAYNNRGWALYQRGDIIHALADFDKAVRLAPKERKPYFNRAAVNANSINFLEKAIQDYDWKKASEFGNLQAKDLLHLYCNKQK